MAKFLAKENVPKYSRQQFLQISVKVCPKLSEETALIIAEETWNSRETSEM